jgi:mono/diheme cytochrome c family protein
MNFQSCTALLALALTVPQLLLAQAYPKRVTEPAAVERGKALYIGSGCSFCHGADARGGNGGVSLLRSQKVLLDQKGEIIGVPITKGVAGTTMIAFALKPSDIADIAEFLHSFDVAGYDSVRLKPAVFTMGNAAEGQKYFAKTCAGCHSATGDLKTIGSKWAKPRDMQQRWLVPRTGNPTTVTITQPDGTRIEGKMDRIDEFLVAMTLADGSKREVTRDGDTPKVEVKSPIDGHLALLPKYRDSDIHNVTAFLDTLK